MGVLFIPPAYPKSQPRRLLLLHFAIVLTLYGLGRYELGPIIEPLLLTAITLVGCTIGYLLARRLPYGRSLLGIKS